MSFYVQRSTGNVWGYVSFGLSSLDEAKKYANDIEIGDQPEPLRIVDENGIVRGWVGRNGFLPTGGNAPED
jgi:hypothetical protein